MLEKHFEPCTRPYPNASEWRLLLLDGHNSHTTWKFQHYCLANRILLHVLPPHTTHWTQPLDVGVFGPLGHYYAEEVNLACRHAPGVNISKPDFIALYERARILGFAADNVVNAWKGSGMHPVDPEKILSKLPVERPTTPEQSQDNPIPYDRTPKSARDLQTSVNGVLHGQLTPTSRTRIQKILKASEDAMLRNMFLEHENETLRESIKVFQRRRGHGRRVNGVGRVTSSHEASQASQASQNSGKSSH